MAASDGKVIVAPDSTGAGIDVSAVTRADGTVVDRQRFVQASNVDTSDDGIVGVQGRAAAVNDRQLRDMLLLLLAEARVHSVLLATGLNVRDDLDVLRQDALADLSVLTQ